MKKSELSNKIVYMLDNIKAICNQSIKHMELEQSDKVIDALNDLEYVGKDPVIKKKRDLHIEVRLPLGINMDGTKLYVTIEVGKFESYAYFKDGVGHIYNTRGARPYALDKNTISVFSSADYKYYDFTIIDMDDVINNLNLIYNTIVELHDHDVDIREFEDVLNEVFVISNVLNDVDAKKRRDFLSRIGRILQDDDNVDMKYARTTRDDLNYCDNLDIVLRRENESNILPKELSLRITLMADDRVWVFLREGNSIHAIKTIVLEKLFGDIRITTDRYKAYINPDKHQAQKITNAIKAVTDYVMSL